MVSKIFERIMTEQMAELFEGDKLFSDRQFGFRSGRISVQGILDLLEKIRDSFESKEYFSSLFCDLSKAFDFVTHSLLLQKLRHYNISENSVKLTQSYLAERYQIVRVGGVSSGAALLNIGIPHGSIFGPILLSIFLNDLPHSYDNGSFVLFVDDTTLAVTGKTEREAQHGLDLGRKAVEAWFVSNRLFLNAEKTQNLLFSLTEV